MSLAADVERHIRDAYPGLILDFKRKVSFSQLRKSAVTSKLACQELLRSNDIEVLRSSRTGGYGSEIILLALRPASRHAKPTPLTEVEYEKRIRLREVDPWQWVLGFSVLGPFYYSRWSSLWKPNTSKTVFDSYGEPPSSFWIDVQSRLLERLQELGLSRLSREILFSPVPWMSYGTIPMPDDLVVPTVSHCLFGFG